MTDGISLQAYVRDTLLAIVAGIQEAQAHNPHGALVGRAPLQGLDAFARDLQGNSITKVDFDVATTVEARESGGVGGSVKVIAFGGIEAGGKREAGRSDVSRIAFTVPLAIPRPPQQAAADEERHRRDSAAIGREYDPYA